MQTEHVRPRNGSKAVAIDNRAEIARIRLFLFLSILGCGGLALALRIFFG